MILRASPKSKITTTRLDSSKIIVKTTDTNSIFETILPKSVKSATKSEPESTTTNDRSSESETKCENTKLTNPNLSKSQNSETFSTEALNKSESCFEESVTLDDLNFVDKAEIDGNTVKNNENISDKSDTMKSFPPVKDDFNFNSETNERQDIFACEICKESFHNKNGLDCHMKLHDDDLRCHLCPYTTKNGEDIGEDCSK